MAKLGDKVFKDANIQTLLNVMEELDTATREEVLRGISRRLTLNGKADIINKIKKLVQTTDPAVKDWIAKAIPNSYITGLKETDRDLGRKVRNITIADLKVLKDLSVHADAVNALMSDAYLDFANSMNGLVRGAEKQINEAIKLQARAKIASNVLSGSEIRQTKKDIINLLGDKGFSVLTDRGGNTWTLKRYSEMLARTHTMRAFNDSAINRAGQFGVDLVQISTHGGACPICAPLEGNIYSLSGDDPNYPRYTIGLPIHPNCRHTLLMRPDLQTENPANV